MTTQVRGSLISPLQERQKWKWYISKHWNLKLQQWKADKKHNIFSFQDFLSNQPLVTLLLTPQKIKENETQFKFKFNLFDYFNLLKFVSFQRNQTREFIKKKKKREKEKK